MENTQARRMLDAMAAVFGAPPGRRPVHARGMVLAGTFTAAPVAARLSRAAHMQGRPVRALARFSGSSGFSWWPDFLPDARGLAVRFLLPDGSATDLVAVSLPRFPVRTPAAFAEMVRALVPRPSLAWRLPWFLLRHPQALRCVPANLRALARPPASYASIPYHAIHAFTWITPYGSERHVRYRWMPEAVRHVSWLRALWRGARHLENELRERLREGALRMHLQVQVARRGDPLDDPSAVWPADRDVITVGTLELATVAAEADLAFDPLRLVPGIVAGPDPVLHFRHEVYALAAARRGRAVARVAEAGEREGEGRTATVVPAARPAAGARPAGAAPGRAR